jgi:hypothetical protein
MAGAPLLARLPLNPELAAMSDAGNVEAIEPVEVDGLLHKLEELISLTTQEQALQHAELVH